MATHVPTDENSHRFKRAWLCYGVASVVLGLGALFAARAYPAGFDWTNHVISALASRKHNPDGGPWLAAAIALAMPLLWPATRLLAHDPASLSKRLRFAGRALRVGLIFATLVGLDRFAFHHFSDIVRKGHEILALVGFLGCYSGIIAAYLHYGCRNAPTRLSANLALSPIIAIGLIELGLYLLQRDTGWSEYDWRGTGAPWYRRFAVWQWLALALLWAAVGHLLHLAQFNCVRKTSNKR